jgi:hypothetical protein
LSHPQHDPVRHSWQSSNPLAHGTSSLHAAVQWLLPKTQTWPGGQGSSSSQRPGSVIGTHAAMQSAHFGQLDVAQPLQNDPGPHDSQKSAPHGAAQTPVEKIQTPPAQSP